VKKILAVAIFAALIIPNICLAMTRADFTLGGLSLNMPYNDVIRIYGEPTSKPGGWAQLVSDCIKYGNDIEIGFLNKKIRYVVTTANNGWKTAAGVYVGMPLDEVLKIYGDDFYTETHDTPLNPAEKYFYYKWSGTKYSWSQVANIYMYEPGDTKFILSVVINGNIVTAIELNQRTPEY